MVERQRAITYSVMIGDKEWFASDRLGECREKVRALLKLNDVEGHLKDDVVIVKRTKTVEATIMNTYETQKQQIQIQEIF